MWHLCVCCQHWTERPCPGCGVGICIDCGDVLCPVCMRVLKYYQDRNLVSVHTGQKWQEHGEIFYLASGEKKLRLPDREETEKVTIPLQGV